jgi:hypothetical protein
MICSSVNRFFTSNLLRMGDWTPNCGATQKRGDVDVAKYSGPDPSTAIKAERSVYKSYSGYVHGAAPHIMDLHSVACEGFSVRGVAGTYRQDEHRADLRNYYFRTLQATAMVAKAVGDGALCTRMMDSAHEYAKAVGLPL